MIVSAYAIDRGYATLVEAQLGDVAIELGPIARAYAELSQCAEVVVVEGAGGFLVPLNARQTGADLAIRLGLPIVLVVGMRLGCLNHPLLTRRQGGAFSPRLPGWGADCILPDIP